MSTTQTKTFRLLKGTHTLAGGKLCKANDPDNCTMELTREQAGTRSLKDRLQVIDTKTATT